MSSIPYNVDITPNKPVNTPCNFSDTVVAPINNFVVAQTPPRLAM